MRMIFSHSNKNYYWDKRLYDWEQAQFTQEYTLPS
jgi:hypothetical protein